MKRAMSRVAACVIGLQLLGCVAEQHEVALTRPCDSAAMKRQALVARRADLMADMKRDVDLGRDGGVPGRSFDDRSTKEADAYVKRVKESWHAADEALGADIRASERRSREAGCHAS